MHKENNFEGYYCQFNVLRYGDFANKTARLKNLNISKGLQDFKRINIFQGF